MNRAHPDSDGTIRVLVATGTSGGHVFPALAFMEAIARSEGIRLLLVMPRGCRVPVNLAGRAFAIRHVSVSSIPLSSGIPLLLGVFRFLKGIAQSFFIMLEFRPQLVVGFGSICSLPVVMCSWLLRVKTLIHEQNVLPGRANRFLTRFADRIAVSFEETQDYLKDIAGKVTVTGNPLRATLVPVDRARACERFGLNTDRFTLLVTGGSQGSRSINLAFARALGSVAGLDKVQVIHIAGARELELVKCMYAAHDVKAEVKLFGFFEEMQYAYSACDAVIARSGATTVAEIIRFRLPAVLVPYPYAYRHQYANASVLGAKGAAIILSDGELGRGALGEVIAGLLADPQRTRLMREAYRGLEYRDAAKACAELALSLVRNG